ncbi:MAG TPA: fibronectin type III-like domain-contianing protein [Gemmatimonadaceae bacterium]|nr:fibronectin type III-like domain-contianing protein [Gemmatimonadaceae bacterium]
MQLYVKDDAASVSRPVRELKGFQRMTPEPGESRRLSFMVTPEALAFYDFYMRRVVEAADVLDFRRRQLGREADGRPHGNRRHDRAR